MSGKEGEDDKGNGEAANMPTKNNGGFIDSYEDFYNFMVKEANTEKVEVTALAIKTSQDGNIIYYVEPWKNNTSTDAVSNLNSAPGYSSKDVIAQYHTHINSAYPSPQDAFFSNEFSIPVRPIGADGRVWEVNIPQPYIVPVLKLRLGNEQSSYPLNPGQLIYNPN